MFSTTTRWFGMCWRRGGIRTWLALTPEGKPIGGPPTDAWPWLCMNSPYLDQVLLENEELVAKYDVDGAWFDILKQNPEGCFCRWCVAEREKLGLKDVKAHNKMVAKRVEGPAERGGPQAVSARAELLQFAAGGGRAG